MGFLNIGTTLVINPDILFNMLMFGVSSFGLFLTIRYQNKKMFDKKVDKTEVEERCKVINKRIDDHILENREDMKDIKRMLNIIIEKHIPNS